MTKKKIVISLIFIAIAVLFVAIGYSVRKKQPAAVQQPEKQPVSVDVQLAKESKSIQQTLFFPATVVGEDEIKIIAKSSGNISASNFNLGDQVFQGSVLATIDDTGNELEIGDQDLRSAEVQQSQSSKEQAKENFDVSKLNYKNLKKIFEAQENDPTLTKTVTKEQVKAAKEQTDIAELQYESAKIGFKSTLDKHLITSPISGFITSKSVSLGDSIIQGQALFGISKTSNIKFQFFVDESQLTQFKINSPIIIEKNNGEKINSKVRRISPVADPVTKRILIEAFPTKQNSGLLSGIVTNASFSFTKYPSTKNNLILPLSTVTVGQNESYMFITDNGKAKKIIVEIVKVDGETAEVKADVSDDTEIIIRGSKLVQDGDEISIN